MNKHFLPKVVAGASILLLEFATATFPIFAQSMPTKEGLATQITADAQAQTSTINADASSTAPASSTTIANTGDNTATSSNSDTNTQTQVDNQNTATVNQTVNAVANTGNNEANRNIAIGGDAGVITSGNAAVNTTSVTQANTNNMAVSSSPTGCSALTDAVNTGNNTSTSSNCTANTTTLVNNGNTTIINQATNTLANTGGNTAARNISIGGSAGVITTGNASTNTSSLVTANGSVMLVGGVSNGHGPGSGASIVLASASDTARYTSLAYANSFFIITNDNRATIAQTCGAPLGPNQLLMNAASCTVNTGGNNSSRNIATGGNAGVINTGDAVLNVIMLANANSNGTRLAFASPGGGSGADIINTGNNADTATASDSNQTVAVTNSNTADVNQTVNAVANTGNNKANRNIAFGGNAGVINTGNATVNTVMGVNVNSNQSLATSAPIVQGSASDPFAAILNSGNESGFTQTANSNNTTKVDNTNLLALVQSSLTSVNTGFNQVIGSIGTTAGNISTGTADANINLNVTSNNNTVMIDQANLVPAPTASYPSPTPTPAAVLTGSSQQNNTTQTPLLIGKANTASQPSYYYSSYNTYPSPSYPGYSYLASAPKFAVGQTGQVFRIGSGDVLAAEVGSPTAAPQSQSQIAWILLSVLSSLIGIGVYISRHSFMDSGLYS